MKILKKVLKEGLVELKLEVPDDLWYLSELMETGNIVRALTKRRLELNRDTKRAERHEKDTVLISVKAENIEFDKTVDRLRVTGNIVAGPETVPTGVTHTLNLKTGMVVTLQKIEWTPSELLRLDEASKAVRSKILLLAIEDGHGAIGMLRDYGVQELGEISESISGKQEEEAHESDTIKFFHLVAKAIENYPDIDRAVVAGPGFIRDDFGSFLKDKYPKLVDKVALEHISAGGNRGLQEIVKRGIIDRIVKETKIRIEMQFLEKFFVEISKDGGLAVRGIEEVMEASNMGAIDTLVVSNARLKKSKIEGITEVETLIKDIRDMKGEILIISGSHEPSEQFESLGGIGATLRFKIKND